MLAPGGRFVALVHYDAHPPIEQLARPYLSLAGIRVDPVLAGLQRVHPLTGLSVLRLADGTQRALQVPDGARVSVPAWAPDGRRLAFTVDQGHGIGVWVADAETGTASQVAGLVVRDVLGGDPLRAGAAARWSRDGRSLLALGAPDGTAAVPEAPVEPHIEETAGKRSQMATFQDLLRTTADEDAFEALATTVPLRVDPVTGGRRELGPPGLYRQLTESPDGGHLLVHRLRRPFSFRVPFYFFARRTEVWSAAGGIERVIADLDVSDEVPRQGVPACARHPGRNRPQPAWPGWKRSTAATLSLRLSIATGSCGWTRRLPASPLRRCCCGTAAWAGPTWTSRTACCSLSTTGTAGG